MKFTPEKKYRFQVPVFFDVFNLSNLSQLVKGTVPLLSMLILSVIPFAWKHIGPQVLTLTVFVHLQKGLYQGKRKGWKAPFVAQVLNLLYCLETGEKPRRDIFQFFLFMSELCFSSKGPNLRNCIRWVFSMLGKTSL